MAQQLDLLSNLSQRPAWLEQLRSGVKQWAEQGVYLGGSSWKYEGWLGQVYSADRYNVRGKFSQKEFERHCLEEYAEWYPTVCGDFAFYTFYEDKVWSELFSQVPSSFQFGFKAPERITAPSFPNQPRYGAVAGQSNPDFLNSDLFVSNFVERLVPYQKQVGYVVLEFPQFHQFTDESRAQFLERLDRFLGDLPKRLRYAIEIRTKKLLTEEYFCVLRRHQVAHTFNSWTRMPSVGEQLNLSEPFTTDFTVARLLLRPGRTYEQAVSAFQPYNNVKDPYPEGYHEAARLVREAKKRSTKRIVFLSVNNRWVGNTHVAISEILKRLTVECSTS